MGPGPVGRTDYKSEEVSRQISYPIKTGLKRYRYRYPESLVERLILILAHQPRLPGMKCS